jgi:hypothetical protein
VRRRRREKSFHYPGREYTRFLPSLAKPETSFAAVSIGVSALLSILENG